MNIEEYTQLRDELTDHRLTLSASKREDYTRGDEDVLANFKNVAKSTGLRPDQVLLVYAQKQFDAVANYVKTGGQSESEPIKERISDVLNYMELLWGLINDPEEQQINFTNITIDPIKLTDHLRELQQEIEEDDHNQWVQQELAESQRQADRYWQEQQEKEELREYWQSTIEKAQWHLDHLDIIHEENGIDFAFDEEDLDDVPF